MFERLEMDLYLITLDSTLEQIEYGPVLAQQTYEEVEAQNPLSVVKLIKVLGEIIDEN